MEIAFLGGTGDIGEGLALRFGIDTDHDIVVGSRDAKRAQAAAAEYTDQLRDRGESVTIVGATNEDAAADADVVVLSIPPFHVGDTVETLSSRLTSDQIIVSPAVGMKGDEDGLHYRPPSVGSVTELVAERAPDDTPVVGAFHNLSAARLANLDATLDVDTLVVGDDEDARGTVIDIASDIDGLRALNVGPLANAPEVESVTPLVINIARYNSDLHDVGVTYH